MGGAAFRVFASCALFTSAFAATSCTYVENYVDARPYAFRSTESERLAVTMNPLDAIVRVAGSGGVCTGTLVTARIVLTSRRCYRSIAFSDLGINPRLRAGVGGGPISFASSDVTTVLESPCHDIVALILAEELIAPPVRLRLGATVAIGEPVRVVGFGVCDGMHGSGRFVGSAGFIEEADDQSLHASAMSCPGDSGGPLVSDWTGEIVGIVLDDGGMTKVARIDVAQDLLARAFVVSHGARFVGPETCR